MFCSLSKKLSFIVFCCILLQITIFCSNVYAQSWFGTILPLSNNTYDLGNNTFWWRNVTAVYLKGKLLCSDIYGGSDADFCVDATGVGAGGANVSTTTCSGTQKVSAIDNSTGVVICSADVDTSNTTAEMIAAINNSGVYNITSWFAYYVDNATERSLFTTTYNTTYDAFVLANISNSTTWWAGLNAFPTLYEANISDLQSYILQSEEGNLNVNKSDYWNNYNVASDLNYKILVYEANITDLQSYILQSEEGNLNVNSSTYWDNMTSFPTLYEANISDLQSYILQSEEGNLNVNGSTYLDGKASSYYLNVGGGITFSNITDISNCSAGYVVKGKVGSAWVCTADLFNTSAQIWTVIDNNTFHKFSQTITWANLSSWSLNNVWTGSLGGGNITTGTITSTQIADGTIATADLASTFAINLGNITNPTNCTAAQKVLGKVNNAWVCSTDLFNTSVEIISVINATADAYYQIKSKSATDLICTNCIDGTEIAELTDADISNTLTASIIAASANADMNDFDIIDVANIGSATDEISGDIYIADNKKIKFGSDQDFCIYFNTTVNALVSTNNC